MSSYTEKQLRNAKRTIYRAELWRHDNADFYTLEIELWACYQARSKIMFSIQERIEWVRSKDRAGKDGEPIKINNSFAPVIARWLWREHPETRQFIELRSCAVGEVMGV